MHCLNCLHRGYLTDAYGAESLCPQCNRSFLLSLLNKAVNERQERIKRANQNALEAIKKFSVGMAGDKRKAVL